MRIEPATAVVGHVAVPGDKSISHRAVLIGSVCEDTTRVTGFGRSGDTQATVDGVRTLGVEIEDVAHDELVVHGVGLRGLHAGAVDCANSGTLMRLLSGIAAGQDGEFMLTGDESLSGRPMERIAAPLRRMGADVETTDGHAPLVVRGSGALRGAELEPEVPSAQVKSAILLAGLNAAGATTVIESVPTRDHTELMLQAAGAKIRRTAKSVTVEPTGALRLGEVAVPGDFSSAAPLLVAAALIPGSDITIHHLGVNPRRAGLLAVLERMGARISVFNRDRVGREPVASVQVQPGELIATEITAEEVPSLVDELPLVALLGSHARGETVVRGARELRVKETDRIEAVNDGLRALDARIQSREDGWTVTGVPIRLRGGRMDARGDHRIAMLAAVAGLASREGVEIEGADTAAISFPGFYDLLEGVVRR
ncbi:MAG TPA: 3-phosphoshikimate 1-carboxyvinyltransferase, partial [Gaiellaceae bacterium]|nr:3-phosphoshikimate 1-carboxyvinyltransferase [Gaiellaceae bacterium]